MRFCLIDRITSCEPGRKLTAVKLLALGEEYLADHFPRFPVMPGVLMLQACVEAAAWLWRASTDFAHPVIVLREVKQVKYGTFLQPGQRLEVTVEMTAQQPAAAQFKARGVSAAGEQTVFTQFGLVGYSLKELRADGAERDAHLQQHWRRQWAWLCAPGMAQS